MRASGASRAAGSPSRAAASRRSRGAEVGANGVDVAKRDRAVRRRGARRSRSAGRGARRRSRRANGRSQRSIPAESEQLAEMVGGVRGGDEASAGAETRARARRARGRGRGRGRASRRRGRQSKQPSRRGAPATSADARVDPRARVSSTIRADWSTRRRRARARGEIRAASSPSPQPTSSTRPGCTSATAWNATSRGVGPVDARGRCAFRAASPASVAYCRATYSGSFRPLTSSWLDDRPPGAPLPGCLPPSQALTVAPTSPNSPSSCILPAAFFPAAYASSSACSREWSVDGVVGSQP